MLTALREKCPITEIFLVRIFLYLDWIQENTDEKSLCICHFSCSAGLKNHIAPNTDLSICLKNGRVPLTKVALFMPCLLTYQRIRHNEPRFIDCQVRSIWFLKRCTFLHEKLFHEETATSSCKSKFSTWKRIILEVPQGSILDPLFFDIFLNDLFLFVENS